MNVTIIKKEGFVLVTCLMMLMVLTLVGLMATNSTMVELMISGNDRTSREAFYRSDSGIYTAPKVIRRTILADSTDDSEINLGSMDFINPIDDTAETASSFYRKIYGFDVATTNISFASGPTNNLQAISVDIFRSGQENLPGGSVEFASGYEGIGHGSTGGIVILYNLGSIGTAKNNGRARIEALYKLIPGTAGGL